MLRPLIISDLDGIGSVTQFPSTCYVAAFA